MPFRNRYRNPWHKGGVTLKPEFYEHNSQCLYDQNGWTVYRQPGGCYDYVFAGCAITQRAAASRPSETIARIIAGYEMVHDDVAAHLRAHGLTCKSYSEA